MNQVTYFCCDCTCTDNSTSAELPRSAPPQAFLAENFWRNYFHGFAVKSWFERLVKPTLWTHVRVCRSFCLAVPHCVPACLPQKQSFAAIGDRRPRLRPSATVGPGRRWRREPQKWGEHHGGIWIAGNFKLSTPPPSWQENSRKLLLAGKKICQFLFLEWNAVHVSTFWTVKKGLLYIFFLFLAYGGCMFLFVPFVQLVGVFPFYPL